MWGANIRISEDPEVFDPKTGELRRLERVCPVNRTVPTDRSPDISTGKGSDGRVLCGLHTTDGQSSRDKGQGQDEDARSVEGQGSVGDTEQGHACGHDQDRATLPE